MEDEPLIRTRLSVDERNLKRLYKKYAAFTAQIESASEQDALALYEAIQAEIISFGMNEARSQLVHDMNASEMAGFQEDLARIEQERQVTEEQIANLQLQLKSAQQERANKIKYDNLAQKINHYPTKTAQKEAIVKLHQELNDLRREKEEYAATWSQRRSQFETIIRALEDLQAQIRQEKEQVEHKDRMAMLADDNVDTEQPDQQNHIASNHGVSNVPTPEAERHERIVSSSSPSTALNGNAAEFKPKEQSKLSSSHISDGGKEEGEEDEDEEEPKMEVDIDIEMDDR